jgi:WD40 repeat protein
MLKRYSGWVNSVVFSHDRRWLALALYIRTIAIWDTETGTLQQTLEDHTRGVNSVAFSRDGRRLASASWDNTVRIWDAKTGVRQQTLEIGTSLRRLAFSCHDSHLGTEIGSVSLSLPSFRSIQPESPVHSQATLAEQRRRRDLESLPIPGSAESTWLAFHELASQDAWG